MQHHRMASLYSDLTTSCWYWSVVICVRKALLILASVVLSASPQLSRDVCVAVFGVALVLHVATQPYRSQYQRNQQSGLTNYARDSNIQEVVSLLTCAMLVLMTSVSSSGGAQSDSQSRSMAAILAVGGSWHLLALLVWARDIAIRVSCRRPECCRRKAVQVLCCTYIDGISYCRCHPCV